MKPMFCRTIAVLSSARWLSVFLVMFAASSNAELVAYKGATLIDGTLSGFVENATVLVGGDKFVAVGSDLDVPQGTRIVDVSGKWIVPGLIDSHVHFMTSGRMYTRPAFFDLTHKVSYEQEIGFIKEHLPDTLRANMCAGVTSVVSMGGPSIEYQARQMAATMDHAPTVFIGHGVIVPMPKFLAEQMIPPWDGELTLKPGMSAEDAVVHVQQGVRKGADLIKTALDSRDSLMIKSMLWYADWQDFQKAVVEEAAKNGLPVTTHSHELEYARGAVEAGASSLQHVVADQPVDEPFVEMLVDEDVVVVPTLAIRKRTFVELFTKELELLEIERRCSVPGVVASWNEPVPSADAQSERYRVQGAMAAANVRALYAAGVPLAVATDSGMIGIPAGAGMHLELRDLNRAGVPADYLIHAATYNSARIAGKEGEYGSIEPGKFADFLILGANPLEDIGHLQDIEQVVKYGKRFAQTELLPRR